MLEHHTFCSMHPGSPGSAPSHGRAAWARCPLALALAPLLVATACERPDPEPCLRASLSVDAASASGTLVTDRATFDLATCRVSLAWSADILEATPLEERFDGGCTQLVVICGEDPEVRVTNGDIFDEGAPFDPLPSRVDMAVDAAARGGRCRAVGEADVTFTQDVEVGEPWPAADEPTTPDFERTFTIEMHLAAPFEPTPSPSRDEDVCDLATSTVLDMTATFTVLADDIEHGTGMTCQQGCCVSES